MLNESMNSSLDLECLSAKLIDHVKDHVTDLSVHSVSSLNSSIFHQINVETNESKVLSTLQRDSFTAETLKSFIRKMWSLKNDRKLADETALSALSLLLPEVASKWWEDTRPYVKNWNLAVALILKVLDDKRTLLDAWREFENSYHQFDKHLKPFLTEQRILLAEIRQFNIGLTEQMEIDLVFYKLNTTIRKKIERKKMTSFEELMKLAEAQHLTECDPNLENWNEKCSYCKRPGHTERICFDKSNETDREEQKKRYRSSLIPSIPIKLNGIPDYVHLATDSHLNVITDQLYCKLLQRGCQFESSKQVVSTVRSNKKNHLQMTTVIVECNNNLIITPVVKLQNTRGNKNCFGISFIESCDLLTYVGCE